MLIETTYPDLNLSFETTAEDIQKYFLNKIQPILDTSVYFEVYNTTPIFNCYSIKNSGDLFQKLKKNPPLHISLVEHYNEFHDFSFSTLHEKMMDLIHDACIEEDEELETKYTDALEVYEKLFDTTKDEVIGYTLFLHYQSSITYRYDVGLHTFFESTLSEDEYKQLLDHQKEMKEYQKRDERFREELDIVEQNIIQNIMNDNSIHLSMSDEEVYNIISEYCNRNSDFKKLSSSEHYSDHEEDFLYSIYHYCFVYKQDERCKILLEQVKNNPNVMLAKNDEQRFELIEELFSEEDIKLIPKKMLSNVLIHAKSYYEINFIPQKVKELAEQKLSQKAIAEQLHISIAKVKAHLPPK